MRKIILLSLLLATPLFAADAACPATWGYASTNGPDKWGQMETAWAACDGGTEQSPIDITTSTLIAGLPVLRFDYVDGPLTVQNNGHELRVPTARGTVSLGGLVGKLEQFHFHTKAEHRINGDQAAGNYISCMRWRMVRLRSPS